MSAVAWAQAPSKTSGTQKGGFNLESFESSQMLNKAQLVKMEALSKKRQGAIKNMEHLARQPNYPNKARVFFMLGEFYWREAKYQYLKLRRKFDQDMEAFEAKRLAIEPTEPTEDYSVSLSYYRKLINEFPNYSRIDEVFYYLGRGALKQGKQTKNPHLLKEGQLRLQKLQKEYPKSRLIAKTHLSLAEHFFDQDSLYFAKTNYEKLLNDHPRSSMYNYALYKLGWVYYNLAKASGSPDDYRKTVNTFQEVVRRVATKRGQVSFREQALNDLVKTYAEMDDSWPEALDYFKGVLKKDKPVYQKMEALATLYVGLDKDKEAIELYNHFIEREPNSRRVPEFMEEVLGVREKIGDFGDVDKEIRRILGYFKPKGRWMTANQSDDEAVEHAIRLGETKLLWLAHRSHQLGDKNSERGKKDVALKMYKRAAQDYGLFLKRFPESKHIYMSTFNYAEILYGYLEDYAGALVQYQSVIDQKSKGKYIEDAALGVIYSSYEIMVQKGLRQAGTRGKVQVEKISEKELRKREQREIERSDLHDLEKSYINAADQYVDLLLDLRKDKEWARKNPKRGSKIPEIMYVAGETFFLHGQFEQAVKRLNRIFEYDANHKYAAVAVVALVQAYAKLRRWEKVEWWARQLIKKKNYKYKSKRELRRYIAIAISENAVDLSKMQKHSDAIKESMRLVKEFSDRKDLASKALMNVAVMYERAKRIKDAVKTYERVIKKYKSEDVAPEAQYVIGVIYENQTRFKESAAAFMKMEKFKKDKRAPDAFWNAALILEAQQDFKGAIKSLNKWLKLFSSTNKDEAADVHFKIGLIMERMDDSKSLKKAEKHYAKFTKKYKDRHVMRVEAFTRAANIMRTLDDRATKSPKNKKKRLIRRHRKKATKYYQAAVNEFPLAMAQIKSFSDAKKQKAKLVTAKGYAARSSFWLAQYVYEDFDALRIPSTLKIKILKDALEKKAIKHQEAEKAFDGVTSYKDADQTICAFFRNGLLYYNFAKELLDVPVPVLPTLDMEDEYRAALEQMAAPVQEKSRVLLIGAIRASHEKGVYNQCAKDAGIYAAKVDPDSFPVSGEEEVSPNKTKDTLMSSNLVRTLRRGDTAVDMKKLTRKQRAAQGGK